MSFTKKASALLLALVLAFSLSVPAFATTNSDGDMTITSGSVTFTNESYAYFDAETGEDLTAYTSYAQLSSSSNFAHLPVIINFTGTGLKINGTTVPTSNNSYDGCAMGRICRESSIGCSLEAFRTCPTGFIHLLMKSLLMKRLRILQRGSGLAQVMKCNPALQQAQNF